MIKQLKKTAESKESVPVLTVVGKATKNVKIEFNGNNSNKRVLSGKNTSAQNPDKLCGDNTADNMAKCTKASKAAFGADGVYFKRKKG